MRRRAEDYIGHRYGMLIAVEIVGKGDHNKTLLRCKCDCGGEKIIPFGNLNTGRSSSCGCIERKNYERLANLNKTHGESKSRLYKEWRGIYTRCYNPNRVDYKDYGGRGIKVSEEWKTYEAFRDWALSHGYKDNLTIDRINVNEDYSPNNCRWVTMKEQGMNRRNTVYITYKNVKKTAKEWSEELGIKYSTIVHRKLNGWSDHESIEGRRRA